MIWKGGRERKREMGDKRERTERGERERKKAREFLSDVASDE